MPVGTGPVVSPVLGADKAGARPMRWCHAAPMRSYAETAARNNADWCDLICRSHDIATAFDDGRWAALRRSPPMYPDAVTLLEDLGADEVLRGIDTSAGCSVKDSFASLDLSPDGFRVLFDAEWIRRPPTGPRESSSLTWTSVATAEALRAWAAAHGGGGEIFRPVLLEDPTVLVLTAHDGDVLLGGAVGNRSAHAVGISNLFTTRDDDDRIWAGAVDAISARFPGLPLVGYEAGADLAAAHRAGFVSTGPLRVWCKD